MMTKNVASWIDLAWHSSLVRENLREWENYFFTKSLLSVMQIAENIDTMFEYMPFKSRWSPVDNFIQLGGVVKCFQVFFFKLIIVFCWIVAWIQPDNTGEKEISWEYFEAFARTIFEIFERWEPWEKVWNCQSK